MIKFIQKHRPNIVCYLLQVAICTFLFGLFTSTNVLIIACAVVWLFDTQIISKVKTALTKVYVWLFISYFILTLVGFLYSEDLKVAGKFLEMRIVILLLPIVLSTIPFKSAHLLKLLSTFAIATLAALIAGLIYSTYLFMDTGDSGYFFNDNLTIILENKAAYFAIYVNIAVVITLFSIKNKPSKVLNYVFLGLLIIFQFLLATRISILVLLIIAILTFVFIARRYSQKMLVAFGVTFALLVSASLILMPQTMNRFESMFSNFDYRFDNPNEVNHFNAEEVSQENWNGLTIRLALWECGFEVIKDNPWIGVGTGDYDKAFRDQVEEVNFIYARKMNFGVHNQYMYTGISFGILGVIIFILSLAIPTYRAITVGNYIFVGFLLVFSISFLSENVLNRYLGIFPFALLTSLTFFHNSKGGQD